ncbi:MAG TPA: hypothetical protein VHP37_05765 [Burkholderiales bacterium]|nr:hypothetical protein [Burkholderiales bacterium]
MDDVQLHEEMHRLERDAEDFRVRAASVAATLEHSGRSVISDPLHQRLTSIHAYLRDELKGARQEAERRAAAPRRRPTWSLRSLFRGEAARA